MASTKRKPNNRNALIQARELEAAWGKAEDEARSLAREHSAALAAHTEIQNELRRLRTRLPSLFDHRGEPVDSPDNAALKLQERVRELPDLEEATLRAQHAREVAAEAERKWHAYVERHGEEILRLQVPEAEQVIQRVHDAITAALAATDEYGAAVSRAEAIAHHNRRIDARRVTGRDNYANLRRTLEGWTGELPNPAKLAPLPSDPEPTIWPGLIDD